MAVLIALAVVVAAGYFVGWQAAVYTLVAAFLGLAPGIAATRSEIRAAGYVLERNKDATGKARYRVGLPPATAPDAKGVEWITPRRVAR